YYNNFSQLGDRTTFASQMFNGTIILAGLCIIIISYFSISELVTTQRMRQIWHDESQNTISHFTTRTAILAGLLTLAGIAFIGIGTFQYSPHPILHNVFARGLPGVITIQFLTLPLLAPMLSKTTYIISDLAIVISGIEGYRWLHGGNTLTNVEALVCLLYLGWFIVFSRQIAAIESDRVHTQLLRAQMQLDQINTQNLPEQESNEIEEAKNIVNIKSRLDANS
ncbi:MAG: ABC transporter permease, partial [Bifidobacteriaceae bacterium]|nr:ABC transporter permease [Bifidobacteriaceae bacterium]